MISEVVGRPGIDLPRYSFVIDISVWREGFLSNSVSVGSSERGFADDEQLEMYLYRGKSRLKSSMGRGGRWSGR